MAVSDNATLTSKGQVTIPKRIREQLGLEAGTEIEFILDDDGSLRVRPKEPPMERLRAIQDQLSAHEIDIDRMRRESKAAWSSHLTEEKS
ncbi:AbrB/MazE/SpoVT family DNA-binding domain-containing protein [Halonotius pteroides]|uniref:AbrB family transcriptional regulator n=1 Tax=Halonotius pteroides TaxID=268735 RepID=A0A3A6Q2D2_9EURY|nr:AbrB/MazE/SpoVT family DNA-binding domain-containing protein [Halonotius pteroides]RJX49853.1 AbrB family transcriptional regulator [Halonotius pteroides]